MKLETLNFDRPDNLQASESPEARGLERDEVRLLVTTPEGNTHATFRDLPNFLEAGDLLVVNESATLPASIPSEGEIGPFIVNLSTRYGKNLWLAEPRWSTSRPGPLPLKPGARISIAGTPARLMTPYPGLPRLWFVQMEGDIEDALACCGAPIRYGYVDDEYPLAAYQTVFSRVPGSAEMPSASRPFTQRTLDDLKARGVETASILLHTGVSSLEMESDDIEDEVMYPEPFEVPEATANAVNRARREGRRIIAVGTTVVRALESAWDGDGISPTSGFTKLYIHPARGVNVVDGLITGFHDPLASHLAMLYAIAGEDMVRSAYEEAVSEGYLWHEFGDSNLILTR
ncbi:MAG: S-adenosylmethionine:tRNA ribosyltransferase-isomerase [Chloroflexi bacterium]|nr:S-adenosylmethionine:tRNA ribosyltransferase-isomerase [Chloroflexota bacterium]MCH8309182.1 S-adenosylmethionine:tRNA ribosyltransferase-isomerase [Chloroflexota bacterium]